MKQAEVRKVRRGGVPGTRVPIRGVVFELEFLAAGGRKALYDAVKTTMKESGVDVTVAQFCRLCVARPLAASLPGLLEALGKERLSQARLLKEISDRYLANLTSSKTHMPAGLNALLAALEERQAAVGLLTYLDEAAHAQVAEHVGLGAGKAVVHIAQGNERQIPCADDWRRLALAMTQRPEGCLALTTSFSACKSAVAAGMRVVAVPDAFTGGHDMGGALMVMDSLGEKCAELILRRMA